jgi:hypothetical protein
MTSESLIYIIPIYLILVLGVSLAATQKRIALSKAILISLFFTPLMGLIALLRTSRKVTVTHYNAQDQCAGCHHTDQPEPEVCESCELIGELHKRLSVNRKYSI